MSTVKAHTGPVYVLVQCLKWKCGALLPLCDWVRSSFWRRLLKGNIYVIVRIPVIKLQPQSDIKPLGALPLAVSGSWGRALGKKCGAKTWSSNTVNVVSLKKTTQSTWLYLSNKSMSSTERLFALVQLMHWTKHRKVKTTGSLDLNMVLLQFTECHFKWNKKHFKRHCSSLNELHSVFIWSLLCCYRGAESGRVYRMILLVLFQYQWGTGPIKSLTKTQNHHSDSLGLRPKKTFFLNPLAFS